MEQGETPTVKPFAPSLAVPLFKNRGGDPVESIRTIQLSGKIARDGCDTLEANANAVAVEDNLRNQRFSCTLRSRSSWI